MQDAVKKDTHAKMEQVLHDLSVAYGHIRTGRASTTLVDRLTIIAYGAPMPLVQLASINTPDARTIAIQPFDPSQIGAIEKAILASDIGITPNNDGRIIRLSVPTLTEERRKEMVKLVHKYAEDHRVTIRKIRHLANDAIKKLEKDHAISEDDSHRLTGEIQKEHDDFIKKIDDEMKRKEAEVMEV
jgi:ribosome recycling factor